MVRQRQDPLRARYRDAPHEASFEDNATASSPGADPFHGTVVAGDGGAGAWAFGIHAAVGGHHDRPNPGDILCAALAACLDSTLRMIAGRMGVELATLHVTVRAAADARGCLMVDPRVPVGFRRIDAAVRLDAAPGTDPALLDKLAAAAERCCVVLQTLRGGVPVQASFHRD
jgi:uncharacterized OsmC-like protein